MNIQLSNLCYKIKNKVIFNNINIDLNLNGDCLAIIGNNGAGKSTFLNIIAGITTNYSGSVYLDSNVKIGYLTFNNPIYQDFSVKENLMFWYQIYNQKKFNIHDDDVIQIIDLFSLQDLLNIKVKSLSSGQKRKVALACILLSNSTLILLDEPFTGLDSVTVEELCAIILKYKRKNTCFIISSHRFDLLERIADKSLKVENGKIESFSLV